MNHGHLYSNQTEIYQQLGCFPAFLLPAINSSLIFRSLVQQTLSAYINNPLPSIFKEKLFVYLSRYFGLDYFTICHSCTLKSLGLDAVEILALETIKYPQTEEDIENDLEILQSQDKISQDWCSNWQLEVSLLRCSSLVFSQPSQIDRCAIVLKESLGQVYYNYLLVFLGYIKLCHQWVESHPEISYQQDCRSQLHLNSLLLSDKRLANFVRANLKLESKKNKSITVAALPQPLLSLLKNNLVSSPLVEDRQLEQIILTNCSIDAPFPVMICDRDENVLYLNRNWIEITGYSASEIPTLTQWKQKAQVKQHKIAKISASNRGQVRSKGSKGTQIQKILQQIVVSLSNLAEELDRIEFQNPITEVEKSKITIVTSNGKQRFWELYCASLNLGKQEQLKISIIEDVTEIVRNEIRLLEIKERLELALDAASIGNWSLNLANNKMSFCRRGLDILGLNDFDGSYRRFLQLIDPEVRQSVDLALARAIKTERDIEVKCPIIKQNYDICWIKLSGKTRYNLQQQPIRLTGIVIDISQHKPARSNIKSNHIEIEKQQVQPSFQELKKVIDFLPAYVCVIDLETKVVSLINRKLARSLGAVDSKSFLGKNISECFPPNYTRQITWQQQQVLTYGQELCVREEVTLADGVHNFETTLTPLCRDDGTIYALLHTSNDIPDLAATEAALTERTQQLEAANKELESFSFSVSHDLQAPLRVINGFSQVLWENYQPDLDDRGKHYLQRIQANSEKMSDLIDALLQLSRVTRSQMKSEIVNLSKIAQDVVEELQTREPDRQIEIKITPNLVAKGDSRLLRIVLCNLLDNAWKYTSKRSQAKIEFDALGEANDRLTFLVRDNGAGFDLEYADKLFTAFKRLHTQTEFPGTGIGLATVQRIIYRHGGKVWADSQRDRGATIYFSL